MTTEQLDKGNELREKLSKLYKSRKELNERAEQKDLLCGIAIGRNNYDYTHIPLTHFDGTIWDIIKLLQDSLDKHIAALEEEFEKL